MSTVSMGSHSTATVKVLHPPVTGSLKAEDGCCSSSSMAPLSCAAGLPSLHDRLRMQFGGGLR